MNKNEPEIFGVCARIADKFGMSAKALKILRYTLFFASVIFPHLIPVYCAAAAIMLVVNKYGK